MIQYRNSTKMSAQVDNDNVKDVDIVSEEDEYLWSFFIFDSELRLIKWTNDEFLKFVEAEDKRIDVELWAENGIGLKNLIENFKRINEKRRISTYKNPLIQFNTNKKFLKNMQESINLMQGSHLVRDMSLVYLIAVFENFLQNVLTISFRKKPETLKTCQKNLNYEELLKFNDMNAIKEGIIEKETMIVNEDIEVIREYFKKKFSIDISKFKDEDIEEIQAFTKRRLGIDISKAFDWHNFKERFYRRNVIIHNLGIPNKLYRQKTGYKGGNEVLKVSMEYLIESLSLFSQISMQIGIAFEEKMKNKDLK